MVCTEERVDAEPGAAPPGPSAPYRTRSAAERREVFEQLSALVATVQAELCAVAVAAEAEGDRLAEALASPAHWVAHLGGMRMSSARELVRTAEALEHLPALRAKLASGELSWDKVRAAVRLAEPATDGLIADEAPDHSADEIAYLAQRARARSRDEEDQGHRTQRITFRTDDTHDGGYISGWLGAEAFARVTQVLDQEAERLGRDEHGEWLPASQRRALAFESIAAAHQAGDRDPDRARLVIHTEASVLTGEQPGNAELHRDVLVGTETLRRLACSAEVVFEIRDAVGDALGIRRARREPPRWLRRYLRRRDRCCRFPGCDLEIRQYHHMVHWTRGGVTDADNLVGLCYRHHRLVHEGGWHAVGDADRLVEFMAPDGRRVASRVPPVDPDVRRRAARAAAGRSRRRHARAGPRAPAPPS